MNLDDHFDVLMKSILWNADKTDTIYIFQAPIYNVDADWVPRGSICWNFRLGGRLRYRRRRAWIDRYSWRGGCRAWIQGDGGNR